MIVVCILLVNRAFDPIFSAVDRGLQVLTPTSDRKTFFDNCQAANKAPQAGHLEQAETLITRALALNPRSEIALVSRANIRAGRYEWKDALQDMDAAIRLAPTHADNYRQRAMIRVFLGQTKEIQDDMATYHRLGGKGSETPQPEEDGTN